MIFLDKVPRVETQLFSTPCKARVLGDRSTFKPSLCLAVQHEATYPEEVKRTKARLEQLLKPISQGPEDFLLRFNAYSSLIDGTDDQLVSEFLAQPHSLREQVEVTDFFPVTV